MTGTEHQRVQGFGRLEDGLRQAGDWYLWGPYLSERQWGTVREDYSPDGEAWDYLPHDHSRSRAYRWGEDGLAGFCDVKGWLCVALALWNGRDPILKERIFGLTGNEGNHGEDAKEYWWYLDGIPSHAWNRWRYHYPQDAFPYADLVIENRRRGKADPEYKLLDTGVFDAGRYWIVEVDYAKADPFDVLMRVSITNAGPDGETLHVLPTVWFRNTWSWDEGGSRPELRDGGDARIELDHPFLGPLEVVAGPAPDGAEPQILWCENETNAVRLFGAAATTPFPKDGINDHVVGGAATVNPAGRGSKAAVWYQLAVDPGQTVEVRLRLRPVGRSLRTAAALGADFSAVMERRRSEADEFYRELTPEQATDDEARVMRQAFAGLLWSKQLYHYDVTRWLAGDPTQPPPAPARQRGRNAGWRHLEAFDIMSMPDKWEYPWFASWDMAFHCVALANVDPAFAKYQLVLLCREWFQHPNGAIPAYEWSFDEVNPPVQAWAALEVFLIDGGTDVDFLSRIFDKLLVNFTWWVNRLDRSGLNLFEGGFLGLDNIGPLDRSKLPPGTSLEQADATAWMAGYALRMAGIAAVLQRAGRPTGDLVLKFLEHFALITEAMNLQGMWDETDGFYYDQLSEADGSTVPVKVRSMVGILPMLTVGVIEERILEEAAVIVKRFSRILARRGIAADPLTTGGQVRGPAGQRRVLLGVAPVDRVLRLLTKLFDEAEFLSPYGLRAVSRWHREHPYTFEVGGVRSTIGYEPAESTTVMFGGNSNWRGPVWFPLNYLAVASLERYAHFFGDDFVMDYPTGSGRPEPLRAVADDLRRRLVSIFLVGPDGRRPCHGPVERLQGDPAWKDNVAFHEYFHGDNGTGLGASHQTGWTGLVADLICRGWRPEGTAQAFNRLVGGDE